MTDLRTIIATLRARVADGTLPADMRDEADKCLYEVDFFTMADKWKEQPEMWEPIRRRLRDRLLALGERLD